MIADYSMGGNVKLLTALFGKGSSIDWCKREEWYEHTLTITRDGEMFWRSEDMYDHESDTLDGTYVLKGSIEKWRIVAKGAKGVLLDPYSHSTSYTRSRAKRKWYRSELESFTMTVT